MVGRQTALGGVMMVGARVITRVIDLATMLVLARILRPTDFGLVAIALSVVTVTESALELPLNQALVRRSSITLAQYNTAFTLSALRGLVMSTILVAAAWPFARFYNDDRLFMLVWLLSLGALARGMISPRLAEYQKNMSFWRDFMIELSGKCMGFAAGVATALLTHSYWSIAVGAVVYPLATLVGSYFLAPYRPRFSLTEFRLFSGFVGWMSVAQLISALNWQSERLLLGKLTPTSQLGLFTTASDIAQIPMLALFGPIMRPLLAAFSLLRDDQERLVRSYQTASSAILTIGVPLLVGESLLAESSIRLVLGSQWMGAVPLLRWLAVSVVPGLFALAAIPLVMSFGQTKSFARRNTIEMCVKLPIMVVGVLQFGFGGIIVARFLSELAAVVFSMLVVRRLIGLSIIAQVLGSWRCITSTLIMAPAVILCSRALASGGGPLRAAIDLIVTASVGAAVYTAALSALWHVAGRPPGIEAMAWNALATVRGKVGLRARTAVAGLGPVERRG